MSANDPKSSSSDNTTRKQRRAAERAARKSGSGASASGTSRSGDNSGGRSGPSMFVVSIGAVVIGLVAVAALVLLSGGLGDNEAVAVSQPGVPPPAEELRQGRTLVQPDTTPPVSIEVYEDPQCPACGQFTERIEPLIIAEHVDKGTASFTYNDYAFLGDESWEASIAMRVAEDMDGKFWDYHQLVYHNQGSENDGGFSRERLADMAEVIGLDRAEFLELMDDPSYRDDVAADNATGAELTINSTPSLVINGEIIRGVPEWGDLDAMIRDAAEAAGAES
ncbi:MAG: thioredoxin domain-containing protein [Chloroflexota bacterium]|nr:thioredoxin domain-containing protein [Chloroflexota bacterium]